jgi:hypothetical protein
MPKVPGTEADSVIHSPLPVAKGAGLYFLLCTLAVLTGLGLLRLMRTRVEERSQAVLAPILSFLLWTLVLGVMGGFRLPVQTVAPWLWGLSLALAVLGFRPMYGLFRHNAPSLVFCLVHGGRNH